MLDISKQLLFDGKQFLEALESSTYDLLLLENLLKKVSPVFAEAKYGV